MALMLTGYEVDDYDEWKQLFDSDPGGRKAVAKAIGCTAQSTTRTRFTWPSNTPRRTTHERSLSQLRDAGVFERFRPMFGPTITEVIEESTY